MDRTTYQRLAFATVHAVQEAIEAKDDSVDAELHGEILTLTRDDGKQFVLNLHNVTQQLWYSSPLSGAWHFTWNGIRWHSTRSDDTLTAILEKEWGIHL
jgi:frataxin